MKKSKFQIINQRLLSVEYQINDAYQKEEIELKIRSNVQIKRDDEKSIAEVILTIFVFPDEDISNVPFTMIISNKGIFEWSADYDNVTIEKLLKSNAPAILMSYMRSVVSQLTSFSSFPPLILPLFDFTKENH